MSTTEATAPEQYKFVKHQRVSLRSIGKDERWLQDRIEEDPSILGLGDDVKVFKRERKQRSGGRLDFMLRDTETAPETLYEVEVMLGATDESHIIRTIEYWDVESRRYRDSDHRAVIVAEAITNRFFNVIWLLSRSLPVIALQLDTIIVGDKLLLHFTKVLDLFEPALTAPEDEEEAGPVDRNYWDKTAPEGMKVFDGIISAIEKCSLPHKVGYLPGWIKLSGTDRIVLSVVPSKAGPCRIYFVRAKSFSESERDQIRKAWENAGVDVRENTKKELSVKITGQFLGGNLSFIADQLKQVFEVSDQA